MGTGCPICGNKHCCHQNTKVSEIISVDNHGRIIFKDGLPREFRRENCAEPECQKWRGDEVIH